MKGELAFLLPSAELTLKDRKGRAGQGGGQASEDSWQTLTP
jgi:hypothetical protein